MSDPVAVPPRLMTKDQAVGYAAAGSVRRFDRWRKAGMMPGRVPGTTLFDRLAIDAAIDKLSGSVAANTNPINPAAEDDPLEAWKKRRDERRKDRGR